MEKESEKSEAVKWKGLGLGLGRGLEEKWDHISLYSKKTALNVNAGQKANTCCTNETWHGGPGLTRYPKSVFANNMGFKPVAASL